MNNEKTIRDPDTECVRCEQPDSTPRPDIHGEVYCDRCYPPRAAFDKAIESATELQRSLERGAGPDLEAKLETARWAITEYMAREAEREGEELNCAGCGRGDARRRPDLEMTYCDGCYYAQLLFNTAMDDLLQRIGEWGKWWMKRNMSARSLAEAIALGGGEAAGLLRDEEVERHRRPIKEVRQAAE